MKNILNKLSDWYFSKEALPYWIVLALDCAIVVGANTLMYFINYGLDATVGHFWPLLGTLMVYLVAYLVGFRVMRTYSGVLRFSSFIDLFCIASALVIGFVLIMIVRLVAPLDEILFPVGGTTLFFGLELATVLMCFERIVVKYMYDMFFRASKQKNVFIYGVCEGGIALAKSINITKPATYKLRGFCSDLESDRGKMLMGKQIYLIDSGIVDVMKDMKIECLLVSPLKSADFRKNSDLQNALIEAGIKIFMMPTVEEWDQKSDLSHTRLKEVDIVDLLPREQIDVDMDAKGELLTGKTILITGSAGSIGSEMVRQIAVYKPRRLVLIDAAETPQHDVRLMMRQFPDVEAHTIVTTICNESRMEEIFRTFRPQYVFHAAAYKHVPMMEDNPSEAVQNNIRGTQILAHKAVKYGVRKFVMISTDKAVNPTNVMGCSKRICEMDVQSMDSAIKAYLSRLEAGECTREDCPFELSADVAKPVTQFVTTRFGNVLGSNGSVIPLFKEQIKAGGPITVTHPDIIRFFMLIPEACKLVLEAGTMGHGGEIFVFDMGSPVKIVDLAKRMIKLSGAKDIEIKFTGLRDGEKLYEEVLADKEQTLPTDHPKIMVATVRDVDYAEVSAQLQRLYDASYRYDDMATVKVMKEMVPEFKSKQSIYEVLD